MNKEFMAGVECESKNGKNFEPFINSLNKQEMEKLIKLQQDHYIIVDDSEIKEGDWVYDTITNTIWTWEKYTEDEIDSKYNGKVFKITHSTQPIECDKMWTPVGGKQWMCNTILCCGKILNPKTKPISLQEVKELIGEVDLKKVAEERFWKWNGKDWEDHEVTQIEKSQYVSGFVSGYNQALEDNKEKKYTEEDMLNAFREGTNAGALHERLSDYDNGDYQDAEEYSKQCEVSFIQSLQPKTEWEVEFIDGKLKLK